MLLRFALNNVTFCDGGNAIGYFYYDTETGVYSNVSITVDGPIFKNKPYIFTEKDSMTGDESYIGFCEGDCGPGSKYCTLRFKKQLNLYYQNKKPIKIETSSTPKTKESSFYGLGTFSQAQSVKSGSLTLMSFYFSLNNVQFSDGGIAKGGFEYNPLTSKYIDASVTVSGPEFSNKSYTFTAKDSMTGDENYIGFCEGNCDPGSKYFTLRFIQPLTGNKNPISIITNSTQDLKKGSFYGMGSFSTAKTAHLGLLDRAIYIPIDASNWMSHISSQTSISQINIPGTHDSAAIGMGLWSCQSSSITEQLEHGVRLLDVRLKFNAKGTTYDIYTCHGDKGFLINMNEFQSLNSLLNECKTFLSTNTSETVLMSLKVDDWNAAKTNQEKADALDVLYDLLNNYTTYPSQNLPNLGDIQGQIFLINRINNESRFGFSLNIPNNTSGQLLPKTTNRSFDVYVQDEYTGSSSSGKLTAIKNAFQHKPQNGILYNFASYSSRPLSVLNSDLIRYFGELDVSNRPEIGWTLFDDVLIECYVAISKSDSNFQMINAADLVIASNFNWDAIQSGKTYITLLQDDASFSKAFLEAKKWMP